ncbi:MULTISPECIES: hypothetical protein [unclassified Bradyrhizobium]
MPMRRSRSALPGLQPGSPPEMPDDFEADVSVDDPEVMAERSTIPRGKYVDQSFRDPSNDKAEHFIKCEICGGWIDMRDMGSVMDHAGPLPHPEEDKPQ